MSEQAQKKGKNWDASLDVTIERGALVIRIGVQTLAHAATYSEWANPWNDEANEYIRSFAIVGAPQFAKDVMHAMLGEDEDGSSPLTHFIDQVSEEAVNQGSLGLHHEDVIIKHGETHVLETWADRSTP